MDLAIFAVSTLIAIGVAGQYFLYSQLNHIKSNWATLRCNPMYMPFSGYVGEDVMTNFTKCSTKTFHDYAGFVMDPVMNELDTAHSAFSEISDSLNSIRSLFSSTRGGLLGIVGMVFGKLHNTMSQTQYLMIRIRTLMGRIVATMYTFVYIFYGGMQTGEAVLNGPIGKTVNVLRNL